jgi:hypothetical protein
LWDVAVTNVKQGRVSEGLEELSMLYDSVLEELSQTLVCINNRDDMVPQYACLLKSIFLR